MQTLFPAVQTGPGSVLAYKGRICFSCTQDFGVVAGKQDSSFCCGGGNGAGQERMFGEAGCPLPVRWSRWCIALVLSLLLEFNMWDILAVLFKT